MTNNCLIYIGWSALVLANSQPLLHLRLVRLPKVDQDLAVHEVRLGAGLLRQGPGHQLAPEQDPARERRALLPALRPGGVLHEEARRHRDAGSRVEVGLAAGPHQEDRRQPGVGGEQEERVRRLQDHPEVEP